MENTTSAFFSLLFLVGGLITLVLGIYDHSPGEVAAGLAIVGGTCAGLSS